LAWFIQNVKWQARDTALPFDGAPHLRDPRAGRSSAVVN
jgi:hypothetical protein